MELGVVRRVGLRRPRARPKQLVGDKGYSTDKVRGFLRRRGIEVVIPCRAYRQARDQFNRHAYRERNQIERLINRFKRFCRIATRYEKSTANYLAVPTIAAITLWL